MKFNHCVSNQVEKKKKKKQQKKKKEENKKKQAEVVLIWNIYFQQLNVTVHRFITSISLCFSPDW